MDDVKTDGKTNLAVIDKDTGEILGETTIKDGMKVKIVTVNQQNDSLNSLVAVNSDLLFIKLFGGNSDMLCDKLSNSEVAMLVFLSKYVCYEDCVLRMNGERNAHAMSMKELAQLHHMKPNTFRKIMASLKAHRVIGVHETGSVNNNQTKWITVNPYVMCRGLKVQRWVADFYADSEWNASKKKSTVVDEAITKAQAETDSTTTNNTSNETKQVQPSLEERKTKREDDEFSDLFD